MGRAREDDETVLRYIAQQYPPFVTSKDIKDGLEYESNDGARRRLNTLVDDGYLDTKKVGARGRIWWLTDRGRQFVAEHSTE